MKHGWKLGSAITLSAIVLLAMTAAHAQTTGNANVSGEKIAKRMDRSGDSAIDYEEFRNAAMRRFSAADANGDGVLSGDEIPAHSLIVQKSEAAAGEVKLHDYSDTLRPVFDGFDADKNGSLSGAELESMAQARRSLKESQP